jgi:hypothetical protein
MSFRNWCLSTTAVAGFVTCGLSVQTVLAADLPPYQAPATPPAESLPAVSGPNFKIDGFGGYFETENTDGGVAGASGSFTMPLGERFGAQLDGMAASVDGDFIGGVAGHLFWRDPATGLLGAYGSYVTRDNSGIDTWRLGAEGELYFGQLSLEAIAGYEDVDSPAGIVDDSNIFAIADAAYYITDDFRVSVGYRHLLDIHIGAVGMEYQLPSDFVSGASLFAEGRIGEDEYAGVWGGLRIAFGGGDKSLIRRHREDDPRNRLPDDLFDIAPCGSGQIFDPIDGFCLNVVEIE